MAIVFGSQKASKKLDTATKNGKTAAWGLKGEVQVVEKYTCPECKGSGREKFTLHDGLHTEVYEKECPYCFGRPELNRVVPLGQTKLWQELDERVRAIEQWIEQQGGSHDRVR